MKPMALFRLALVVFAESRFEIFGALKTRSLTIPSLINGQLRGFRSTCRNRKCWPGNDLTGHFRQGYVVPRTAGI